MRHVHRNIWNRLKTCSMLSSYRILQFVCKLRIDLASFLLNSN